MAKMTFVEFVGAYKDYKKKNGKSARLSEAEFKGLRKEYTHLLNESKRVSSTSIKTLEESAEKNLGLSKIDSSQIEYVNLTGDDEISVAKTSGKYLIEQYWNDFIEFIAEYLPF